MRKGPVDDRARARILAQVCDIMLQVRMIVSVSRVYLWLFPIVLCLVIQSIRDTSVAVVVV